MLFNTIDFLIFLPIVFLLYWFVLGKKITYQNILLLVASYVFYGWWDWKFLFLILISTVSDYLLGYYIQKSTRKKALLVASLLINLGILGFFKYYNFFIESFVEAFSLFGKELEIGLLEIVLPVGISFYTFQTMSYCIDVYRGKMKATTDFVSFAAFVSFFPQLVAGPIERASHLLPQFHIKRKFDYDLGADGLLQIASGFIKKVIIADNVALIVNDIFANYSELNGIVLFLGGALFAFQIYCDFSGYSDMAIGIAKLFGFNLSRNFNFPYFSRDIAEFWRRWHISLSTWFRDYLYIPLGGSRGSKWRIARNVLVVFLVSGFWHGANSTFIIWGGLNAIYFLPLILLDKNRVHTNLVAEKSLFPSFKEVLQMGATFVLVVFAWVVFRSETIADTLVYWEIMFTDSFSWKNVVEAHNYLYWEEYYQYLVYVFIFVIFEWIQRRKRHLLEIRSLPVYARWTIYLAVVVCIINLGQDNEVPFIYFQF
jgi:D-alanyl-lipoteichoic acid acyltransferase DltB (MBOAT superfamily)